MKKFFAQFLCVSLFAFALFTPSALVQAQDYKIGRDKAPPNIHGYKFGINATNVIYGDSTLDKGMFLGLYRPYFRYSYHEKHGFMMRGKLTLKHLGEAPASGEQTQAVGSLEVLRVKLNFGRHRLRVGRDFYLMGRGLLFSNFADGAAYTFLSKLVTVQGLALYSGDYTPSSCHISIIGCKGSQTSFDVQNLPADSAVTNAGKRVFAGAQAISRPFFGQQFSVLGLYTAHLISEDESSAERYKVNPYWFGAGVRGYILIAAVRYRAEALYLGGTTFNKSSGTSSAQANISAMAGTAEVSYKLPVLKTMQPKATVQVALASGDADKEAVRNQAQTNTAGNDTAFFHYGSFSGGLGLKPLLSNIQIYRAGLNIKPLRMFYMMRRFVVVAKYSQYYKMSPSGPISDTNATEAEAGIGHGADLGFNWGFRSDLRFSMAAGFFWRGNAYASDKRDTQIALVTSLTFIL